MAESLSVLEWPLLAQSGHSHNERLEKARRFGG